MNMLSRFSPVIPTWATDADVSEDITDVWMDERPSAADDPKQVTAHFEIKNGVDAGRLRGDNTEAILLGLTVSDDVRPGQPLNTVYYNRDQAAMLFELATIERIERVATAEAQDDLYDHLRVPGAC